MIACISEIQIMFFSFPLTLLHLLGAGSVFSTAAVVEAQHGSVAATNEVIPVDVRVNSEFGLIVEVAEGQAHHRLVVIVDLAVKGGRIRPVVIVRW